MGAAIAGVAVGLLLGRTGRASPGRTDVSASAAPAAGVASAGLTAPPAGQGPAPSPPAPRGREPAAAPSPASSSPAEPVATENTTEAPPPPNEWEKIPLDRAFGESLGSFETRKAFAKELRSLDTFLPCVRAWKAPPNLDKVEIETELRLRSEEGVLVVEDRVILEGNVSDAALEECVIARSRGRRIPVPGIEPGRRYRVKWGGVAALRER